MISDKDLTAQLPNVIAATHFAGLGERYEGKVRDCYSRGDTRILITTDRLSCFDRVVTTIPFKGQILNQMALHWFRLSSDIVDNHLIDVPDASAVVVKNCKILPIEVVVRGYLAGSAVKDYEAGKDISGIRLPPGMKASQKLPHPMVTPSTKAELGTHDEPISEAAIVEGGIVEKRLWEEVREKALALFALGEKMAAERGLILVDTKYEFGLYGGKLLLADEIHTLDCSRYWKQDTYAERFAGGELPEMLDKQPIRVWLLEQGFKGDGPIPHFDDARRVAIARHYVSSYEQITGEDFSAEVAPALQRIERNLARFAQS